MHISPKRIGKIIKYAGLNVWPHELVMADILAEDGHVVEFIKPVDRKGESTPDVLIDGVRWELRSPKSGKLDSVERNLKRGSKQSKRIVFSSCRIKRIPDKAIIRELTTKSHANKSVSSLRFINRHGKIIDIK